MQCGRNGGDRTYLNLVEDYSHEVDWGNMNAYQSKVNQTEGLYFFVKDGKFYSAGGALGALNLDGSFGKVVIDYNKTNNEPDSQIGRITDSEIFCNFRNFMRLIIAK